MTTAAPAGASDDPELLRLIGRLSNSDVVWDGTFVGLNPTIISEEARRLLDYGEGALVPLLALLDDEDKFVAAHVLLTLLSGVEFATSPWNGLAVELGADGTARIDPEQRSELSRRWRNWYEALPHPRSLPLS